MGEGTATPPFSCLIPVYPPTCFLLAVKTWERSSRALPAKWELQQFEGSPHTDTSAGGVPGVSVLGWGRPCLKNVLRSTPCYAVAPGRWEAE